MNKSYAVSFHKIINSLLYALIGIFFIFICTGYSSASSISPTPRVSINSPSWGYSEFSNFMNLDIQINAAGSASIIGHSLEIIPYVCPTESIFEDCELDFISRITYTFQSLNETNNFNVSIPGYYRNANFIYFFIYDTITGNGSFAGDIYDNLDHHYINYMGSRTPVYRLYNKVQGTHFYTNNYFEKKNLLTNYSNLFNYEGVAYFSDTIKYDNNLPVHRFYNFKQGVHFYTINQAEATNVNNNMSNTYRYEGVAYYSLQNQDIGSSPVHRFYNFKQGVHFYTINQAEATNVNNNLYSTYKYEGVAYYAFN